MDKKIDLRLYSKEKRKLLDIIGLSKTAVSNLRCFAPYLQAENVMIYYPTKYELNFMDLVSDDKNFYLPKVSGKNLLVCSYCEDCVKSVFGVMEPITPPVEPKVLDLVVVPSLMVDESGYRLGYGGGYYDRFLKNLNAVKTVTVIPKCLFVEKLPREDFDVPIDDVIII